MSNVNGFFLAPGYGNAAFYVTHVAYGVASSVDQGESANFRTAYFHNVWTADFYLSLVFNSWDAYQAGADWFRAYMMAASDPNNTSISPMTVVVPSKNFYSQGIPEMGISYGDHVPAITYPMTVSFVASVSSIAPTEIDYAPPTSLGPNNSKFSPIQNSYGINPGDAALYDPVFPPAAVTPDNSAPANIVKTTKVPK
jgi:hypothetical protein